MLQFSKELIDEIHQTINKPKLKKYFKLNGLEEMLLAFEPFIQMVEVESTVSVCRDTKDDFLLALAKDGKADYLITGDKDLLILEKFGKTKIKTFVVFLDELKNRSAS